MILVQHETYEEWLKWRMTGLGSSDACAVMGVSPWQTREELWALKNELMLPKPSNPAMRRGLELEMPAREAYMKLTGIPVRPECVQHDKYPFLLASLDGLNLDQRRLVEIKCPGKVDHTMALRGRIPDKYLWQCAHQLLVTGFSCMEYFSFDGTEGAQPILYQRNAKWEARLLEEEKLFWKAVCDVIPPGGLKTTSKASKKEWEFPVRQNRERAPKKPSISFQERLKNVVEFRSRR